jgi:hypothetical protein
MLRKALWYNNIKGSNKNTTKQNEITPSGGQNKCVSIVRAIIKTLYYHLMTSFIS